MERTRPTSVKAFREMALAGNLSKARRLTLEFLIDRHGGWKHGGKTFLGTTAGEVNHALAPNVPHPSYHRRLDELGERGLARVIGSRPCTVTGNLANEWDIVIDAETSVTPSTPVEKLGYIKFSKGEMQRLDTGKWKARLVVQGIPTEKVKRGRKVYVAVCSTQERAMARLILAVSIDLGYDRLRKVMLPISMEES